jgi:hypothetical protein
LGATASKYKWPRGFNYILLKFAPRLARGGFSFTGETMEFKFRDVADFTIYLFFFSFFFFNSLGQTKPDFGAVPELNMCQRNYGF